MAGVLAVLLLAAGCLRLLTFVLHEPLLAYSNNFDMLRLQACHQVWPADPAIPAGSPTPASPLEHYTLVTYPHLAGACLFSSELLFTAPAITLARWSGNTAINIRSIGLTRVLVLVATALLASWQFWRQRHSAVLLAHALLFAGLLADPGITLYLNTFYSEFSAVYFLYLSLLGLLLLVLADGQARASWPLLAGLAGLALAKPQHLPLALWLALAVAGYCAVRRYQRLVLPVLASVLLPLALCLGGLLHTRDAGMAEANRVDMLGALLGAVDSDSQSTILHWLALPDACRSLAGSNWHRLHREGDVPCPAAAQVAYPRIAGLLASHPRFLLATISQAIPRTQRWIMGFYPQVAGQPGKSATDYHGSVATLVKALPPPLFLLWFCLPLLAVPAGTLLARQLPRYPQQHWRSAIAGLVLLVSLQWVVLLVAVLGDGFVDFAKHTHLAIALLLTISLLLLCGGMTVLCQRYLYNTAVPSQTDAVNAPDTRPAT